MIYTQRLFIFLLVLFISLVWASAVPAELTVEDYTDNNSYSDACDPEFDERLHWQNYFSTKDQTEIKFRGTLTGYTIQIGSSRWNVTVDEIIIGPQPCSSEITIKLVNYPPYGYFDPNLTIGDIVEVHGEYYHDYDECYVSLNGREDYYIKGADCGSILDYGISSGTYPPGQIVIADMKYKSNLNTPTHYEGILEVRSPTGQIYNNSNIELTAPFALDWFGYNKGNHLDVRIPKDASAGWYDAKLELRNYYLNYSCDEIDWKEKQFRIEDSNVLEWSEDMRITNDSADSINPRIAVDSNNNVHIFWKDNRDGNYWIYYTKLDNHGNILIDDKQIVSLPFISANELSTYNFPSIAIDSRDNLHLAFIEYVDTSIYKVFYIKLDNNGVLLGDIIEVDDNLALKRSSDIAVDPDNNIYIIWEDYTDYPSEVYYTKLDISGNILIKSERLTHDTKTSGFPRIAVDSDNNIHSVSGGALDYYFPDISIDSNDYIHTIYCSEGIPQWLIPPGIYYDKFDKYENIVINSKLIIDSNSATRPVIAIDSIENVHVIWLDNEKILYNKINNNGEKFFNDIQLTFDPTSPWKADIAIDSNDEIHLAWQDDKDGNYEIYYKTSSTCIPLDNWPMFHHDQRHTGYSDSTTPDNTNLAWIFKTEGDVTSSPVVLNNKVFTGSDDGKIYCLNENSGKLIWFYQTNGPVRSSPAVVNDRIYVGSRDNKVYCLNTSTGNLIWNYETGDWVDSSPTVVNGRVFIGSKDHNVYCLDENNGQKIWNYSTLGQVYSSAAVAGGVVYIGDNSGKLYALSEEDGYVNWDYETPGSIKSSPLVVNEKIYVGSFFLNYLYCFNENGDLLWVSNDIQSTVTSSPGYANGKIYVGCSDKKIYCLDESNGNLIWSNETAGCVTSSPAIADGKIFVGSCDDKIYAFDKDNGELIWYYKTGRDVWSSPAVANGKVIVGSNDGNIYAFCKDGAKIIEVDDDFIDDPQSHKWDTIQEGVNDANNGDTVLVYNGTYYENVVVNKSGITLKGIDNPIVEDGGFSVIPDSNVIENIIIEGFDLRTGWGIHCFIVNDSMFLNNTITHSGWFSGILFEWSYNNTIMWNEILNSNCGIQLFARCSNNTIIGNNISNNSIGINLIGKAGNNTIYHNNLIDNTIQANDDVDPVQWGENKWDNSYPSGGNYWNDYNGTDANNDGIGDTPYNISGSASAQDRYPLVPVKGMCGDLDGNSVVNIMDVRLLINNVSGAGYPVDPCAGDVNGDDDIDRDDVWLLVRHVFDPDAYLLNCAIY